MINLGKTHRQRQKEDTKDLILRTAYKLFAERGYADTTMRSLAKEAGVGLVNGIAVAVTCGIGVYLWSRSTGLVLVIMISMVLAMVIAGLAGAIVPIVLKRLGQDPAQSSSIILTTVTDVAGFFSFLGIATLLSGMLDA